MLNQERLYLHGSHGWGVGVVVESESARLLQGVSRCRFPRPRDTPSTFLTFLYPPSVPPSPSTLRVRPLYTSLPSYGFQDKETLLGVHFTFGKQLRTLPWTVYYGISLCFRLVP